MPVLLMVGVLGVASMSVYLLAVRWVSWDLVPVAALARIRWWHRHAPALLVISVLVALTGLVVTL
jgi:hypothetical protein